MLAEGPKLLELSLFTYWVLPRDKVRPLADKLKETDESWVVIPEAAQQDRVNNLVRDAAENIFDEATRAKFKRRLEEMAYLVLDGGDVNSARAALATALAIGSDAPVTSIPFLPALIDRSLTVFEATQAEEGEPEESRIILPFGAGPALEHEH